MHRFVANVASKARLANNTTSQIGTSLSWSRNYAAKDIRIGAQSRHHTTNNAVAGDDGPSSATVRIRATFVEGTKQVAFAMNSLDLRCPVGGQIGLPDSRILYTVLRSPHVHKKSREQFEMRIKRRLLVMETNSHELRKKYFWLKRLRIFGAEYEVQISCKTRLPKREIAQNVGSEADSVEEGILPGDGVALLNASKELNKLPTA